MTLIEYKASGLNNVWIHGSESQEGTTIPFINMVHEEIAYQLVYKESQLTEAEISFISGVFLWGGKPNGILVG